MGSAVLDHRCPHRRRDPGRSRPLPAVAIEGSVPLQVPHADRLHHDLMAGWDRRGVADGHAARCVLPWLLLAAVRASVPAWHDEHRRDGLDQVLIFAEKTLPWGRTAARIAAGVLVPHGMLVVAEPHLLPTFAPGMGKPNSPAPMPIGCDYGSGVGD